MQKKSYLKKQSSADSVTFSARVYSLLKYVPAGKVTTYKAIAEALGTKAYQAVGNALNKNPHAPIVPCHRVVKSDGSVGGYSEGAKKKISLLKMESIETKCGKIINFRKKLFIVSQSSRMSEFSIQSRTGGVNYPTTIGKILSMLKNHPMQ